VTIEPHRIEAAARIIDPGAWKQGYEEVFRDRRAWALAVANDALAASFPELAAGTAWVAPTEASHAMWTLEVSGITWPASAWEMLRDAHLSKGKDDDHG